MSDDEILSDDDDSTDEVCAQCETRPPLPQSELCERCEDAWDG